MKPSKAIIIGTGKPVGHLAFTSAIVQEKERQIKYSSLAGAQTINKHLRRPRRRKIEQGQRRNLRKDPRGDEIKLVSIEHQ
jgi:hypothetical protein